MYIAPKKHANMISARPTVRKNIVAVGGGGGGVAAGVGVRGVASLIDLIRFDLVFESSRAGGGNMGGGLDSVDSVFESSQDPSFKIQDAHKNFSPNQMNQACPSAPSPPPTTHPPELITMKFFLTIGFLQGNPTHK